MIVENYDIRKLAILLVATVFALIVVIWLYHFLFFGKIAAKTDSSRNIIRITQLSGNEVKTATYQKQGKSLSVRVKPGTYAVSVYGPSGTYGVSKTVNVKAHRKIKLSFRPAAASIAEPVLGRAVKGVFATSNELFYLDAVSGLLRRVDSQGNLSTPLPNLRFQGVHWASAKLAIAQALDNNIYLIQNGAAVPLQLPFTPNESETTGYAISPDGQIFVSNRDAVYASLKGGGFAKIRSTGGISTKLSSSRHAVAVIELGKREGANSLATVDTSGNKISEKPIDATQVAWSPDGKYLAAYRRGSYVILKPDLSQVKILSAPQSTAAVWLGDGHSLLYNIANQLWQYNLSGDQSRQLTSTATGSSINGVYSDSGATHAYISAIKGDDGEGNLSRIDLDSRSPGGSMSALSAFLPGSIGVCSFNYINFIKPTLTIEYPNLETSPELCVNAAKSQLRYFSLNPNSFKYEIMPTNQ